MFNLFKRKPNEIKIAQQIEKFVFNGVQTEKGIRVEDVILVMSTIVAERCIDLAGDYDLRNHDHSPANIIFSDKINSLLAGNNISNDWNQLPKESAFGMLYQKTKTSFPHDFFPKIKDIFENFTKHAGEPIEFGNIPLSVPKDNYPFLNPLRSGYESRPSIDKMLKPVLNDKAKCLSITIHSLSTIILKTRTAINPSVALLLSFETINGVSKIASLTDKAINDLESK